MHHHKEEDRYNFERRRNMNHDFVPAVKMVMSGLAYSVQNVCVKMSGAVFAFWVVVFFRGIIGAMIAFLMWCWTWTNRRRDRPVLTKHNHVVLLSRALFGGATIVSGYIAVMRLTLSQAVFLTSTSPIFTAILDRMVHGEKWLMIHWFSIMLCLSGIWVSTSSPTLSHDWIGIICGLSSAISQACVNTTIRMIRDESPYLVTIWGMMGSVVMSMPGAILDLVVHDPMVRATTWEVCSILTTGVLSMVAQTLKTSSLATASSSSIIILRYTEIVFSLLWDFAIFHNPIEDHVYIGGCLIITGCIILSCGKQK